MDLAPTWKYGYCKQTNPLQDQIAHALHKNLHRIQQLRDERYARSQDIEKELQADLEDLGFLRSATLRSVAGLFVAGSDFEIDFFNPSHGMGIEVEKGKHFSVWRNVIKFCESPKVRHGVLLVPYEKLGSQGTEKVFENTLASLNNVHYLYERLDSLLCYGY